MVKRPRYGGVSSQGRDGLPDSLGKRESPQGEFTEASGPFGRIEREATRQTEAERQGEQGQGALMVKTDKPFPRLKPQKAHAVIREHFNRRWEQEIQRARRGLQNAQTPARAADAFDAIDKAQQQRQREACHGVCATGLEPAG